MSLDDECSEDALPLIRRDFISSFLRRIEEENQRRIYMALVCHGIAVPQPQDAAPEQPRPATFEEYAKPVVSAYARHRLRQMLDSGYDSTREVDKLFDRIDKSTSRRKPDIENPTAIKHGLQLTVETLDTIYEVHCLLEQLLQLAVDEVRAYGKHQVSLKGDLQRVDKRANDEHAYYNNWREIYNGIVRRQR